MRNAPKLSASGGRGGFAPWPPKQGAQSLDPLSAPEPHHGLSRALAITPDPRSPGDSVAEWLACWTQAQKARVQISLPPGLWLTSPAGWLLRTGISSGTLRSVIEYGLPLAFSVAPAAALWLCGGREMGQVPGVGQARARKTPSPEYFYD